MRYLMVLTMVLWGTTTTPVEARSLFSKFSSGLKDSFQRTAPSPPGQPESGPGGSRYPHRGTRIHTETLNTSFGEMDYTVYEPALPRPRSAPVVVFLMGNSSYLSSKISHQLYSAFYTHLSRKGYIVIHPDNSYSEPSRLPPGSDANDIDDILAELIRGALAQQESEAVRPQRDSKGMRFALGGHSAGGLLSLMLANQSETFHLPVPRALLLMDGLAPVTPETNEFEAGANPMFIGFMKAPKTFENIGPETSLMVVRTIDSLMADYSVRESLPYMTSYMVWDDAEGRSRLVNVPDENYNYVYLQRDDHGLPTIESAHLTGLGTRSSWLNSLVNLLADLIPKDILRNAMVVDTADYAIWRRFEALLNVQLKGRNFDRKYAFDDGGSAFRSLGRWSDGTPVRSVLGKSDFAPLFKVQSPFPPKPAAPDGLLVSGAPAIRFIGSIMVPLRAHVANFGTAPTHILAARVVGEDAKYFHLDASVLEGKTVGSRKELGFSMQFDGFRRDRPMRAKLEIQYEMKGRRYVIFRNLEGYGN